MARPRPVVTGRGALEREREFVFAPFQNRRSVPEHNLSFPMRIWAKTWQIATISDNFRLKGLSSPYNPLELLGIVSVFPRNLSDQLPWKRSNVRIVFAFP